MVEKIPMLNIKELFFCRFQICTNFDLHLNDEDLRELRKIDDDTLRKNADFFNFTQEIIDRIFKPIIFYAGIKNIEALDTERLRIYPELREKINKVGLCIYLLEPLSTYRITETERGWYCEYNKKDEDDVMCYELDSIENFRRSNKFECITVNSAEHEIKRVFNKKYKKINIQTKILFWPFGVEGTFENPDHSKINKKFWCANKRYSPHRHVIASYLISKIPKHMLNLSWFSESKVEHLTERMDLDLLMEKKDSVLKGLRELDELAPMSFDAQIKSKISIYENYHIDYDKINTAVLYKESFCAIINETRFFQSTSIISEKIINPILNNRFFIIVGPPRTLHHLRKFGIKTFGDWIDESYDEEPDHNIRLLKILDIIDYINSKDIEELREIYKEMQEIVLHNYYCGVNMELHWHRNLLQQRVF